jgi:REP element-mobilizing transposase RayT
MRKAPQLELVARRKRPRGSPPLGRRVRPERVGFVSHLTRPEHDSRHPLHLTMRRVRLAPSFREERIYRVILVELADAKRRGIRVLQYSVQHDHLHLMVEGGDRKELAKKLRTLISRVALAVNRTAERRGQLFRDRYHRHDLTTPREVRNALRYILFNTRKHAKGYDPLDAMSSTPWFEAWSPDRAPDPGRIADARSRWWPNGSPISPPATWLAVKGWLRAGGPLAFDEMPSVLR